jgi:hypothetical protein
MCSKQQKRNTLQCLAFGSPYQTSINLQMFFGLGEKPNGNQRITEKEFEEFFIKTILPIYPSSTTYTATGYYKDNLGIPQNNITKVFQVLTRDSACKTKQNAAYISQQFSAQFGPNNSPFVTLNYSNAEYSS